MINQRLIKECALKGAIDIAALFRVSDMDEWRETLAAILPKVEEILNDYALQEAALRRRMDPLNHNHPSEN